MIVGDWMHIFITGGTRGIGYALVNEFVAKGHKVSFTGTSETSVMNANITNIDQARGYVLDVRYKDQIEQVAKNAEVTFGPIDIWINNAGVPQNHDHIEKLSVTTTNQVIDVNIKGLVYGTQVAITMLQALGGTVYNMEGLGSNGMIIKGESLYGGSKRFVRYLSKAAHKETKGTPVTVGTLQPGMVFTSFLLDNMSEDGMTIARILGSKPEDVATFLVKQMLKGKRIIAYLTNIRMIGRFLKYPFVRQNKDVM
jgi:NADP-dependent 3-hydroxy acid dehydrogenase YdfG